MDKRCAKDPKGKAESSQNSTKSSPKDTGQPMSHRLGIPEAMAAIERYTSATSAIDTNEALDQQLAMLLGPPVSPEPDPHPLLSELLTASQFISEYEVMDFLVEGVIEETRLYALTAPTGTGKTAVALTLAESIALGLKFGALQTKKAGVLFLAGENPTDVRVRFMAMVDKNPALKEAPIYFIKNPFDIEEAYTQIKVMLDLYDDIKLVIIDTLQAFFIGDDANSNTQKIGFAKSLRSICNFGVAVLVNAHPVKNPQKHNNEPYGGGSFVNEIDGNLALWPEADGSIEFYWCKKFRGSFEPFKLELKHVEVESARNSRGEKLTTVIAKPIDDQRERQIHSQSQTDDMHVLRLFQDIGVIKRQVDVAKRLDWKYPKGTPDGSRVRRVIDRLLKDGLITENRHGYCINKKGKDVLRDETPF